MGDSKNQTQATSIPGIERSTGIPWGAWIKIFDAENASKLAHNDIAKIARQAVPESLKNPDWWAQGIAIAYEQHTGMRVPGQTSAGDFRVGASRTVTGDRDETIERWVAGAGLLREHRGHQIVNTRRSRTPKRTFWRADLEGAGRVEVAAIAKDDSRSLLTIDHTKLESSDEIEEWRTYWKSLLAAL